MPTRSEGQLPDPQLDGFRATADRDAAHAPIIRLALEHLGDRPARVLDLGCGAGTLLARLATHHPSLRPTGVEMQPDAVQAARTLLAPFGGVVHQGDLFACEEVWTEQPYSLVLLMPGRLLEHPDRAERLRARLASHAEATLVYAYGDWLTRHAGLDRLTALAGLQIMPVAADASAPPVWRSCALVGG